MLVLFGQALEKPTMQSITKSVEIIIIIGRLLLLPNRLKIHSSRIFN